MIARVLYGLFRWGRVPPVELDVLQAEGIVVRHEGFAGSVTYRGYRAPGRVFLGKRTWFLGSLVVTNTRIAVYAFSRPVLAAALGDDRLPVFSVDARGRLLVVVDAAASGQSGTVELRLRVPDPGRIVAMVEGGETVTVAALAGC